MVKKLYFDGKELLLEEVAKNDNAVLYSYESNGFIVSATKPEILREFPELDKNFVMDISRDYIISKDGKFIFHDFDGNEVFEDEVETKF